METVFAKELIEQYKRDEITALVFCNKYIDLSAEDDVDDTILEQPFNDTVFSLCVHYLDPTENKAEVEEEIRRHIVSI